MSSLKKKLYQFTNWEFDITKVNEAIKVYNFYDKETKNSIENGNIKELRIFFKDERIIKIKTERIITDKETIECFDIERKLWFAFNFNEIIYYTIEKVGEENV